MVLSNYLNSRVDLTNRRVDFGDKCVINFYRLKINRAHIAVSPQGQIISSGRS